ANVAHAGALRIGSRKNGCVRNNSSRRLGVGMLEDDAFRGETIKVRRKRTFGTEETRAVGAGGAEGDEHQVGFGCGCAESETNTNTNKDQAHAGNRFPAHDSKCRSCAAIDQNSKPPVLTSMQLRVQSYVPAPRDFQSHGDVEITTHR